MDKTTIKNNIVNAVNAIGSQDSWLDEFDAMSVAFRIMVEQMEGLGFTFIKRETEVGFIKLIDVQGDSYVQEPQVIEALEDIERPRHWVNWVMATNKAAMRGLGMYKEFICGVGPVRQGKA